MAKTEGFPIAKTEGFRALLILGMNLGEDALRNGASSPKLITGLSNPDFVMDHLSFGSL